MLGKPRQHSNPSGNFSILLPSRPATGPFMASSRLKLLYHEFDGDARTMSQCPSAVWKDAEMYEFEHLLWDFVTKGYQGSIYEEFSHTEGMIVWIRSVSRHSMYIIVVYYSDLTLDDHTIVFCREN